jgi:TetR/AcrR family transcriptional repressor of nem operon
MARSKEFDRDDALHKAIGVFCEKGYAATSTDELMRAMGISRQSMYDTFGDKRQLFLEALRRYSSDSVSEQIRSLEEAASPLTGIRSTLIGFATRAKREGVTGCMGVNAVCEFGGSDTDVNTITDTAGDRLNAALRKALSAAKQRKEISSSIEERAAADFLQATILGIKVAARSGVTAGSLRSIARFALRGLVPSSVSSRC